MQKLCDLAAKKTYTIFATQISKHGVVVQLVRIPACHAGGRGFESRPYRLLIEVEHERSCSTFFISSVHSLFAPMGRPWREEWGREGGEDSSILELIMLHRLR